MPKFKTTKPKEPKKSNAGRKPKPTTLHVLNGNPSKINLEERQQNEPRFSPGLPACPEWLSKDAKQEWERLLPELDATSMLKKVDMAAFAGYCDSLAMWKRANKVIDMEGLTVETIQGSLKAHPAVAIRDKALEKMKSFAIEFGFTPASRSRVTQPDQDKEEDPMEAMLKKRGG